MTYVETAGLGGSKSVPLLKFMKFIVFTRSIGPSTITRPPKPFRYCPGGAGM